MGKTPQEQSWYFTLGRWFGLQIAGKALSFALGLPVVTATLAAWLLYAQGQPVEWVFLGFLAAMAFVSSAANNIRAFALSYSVADKFHSTGVAIDVGMCTESHKVGYRVGVLFANNSDIALEFEVERVSAHVNGRIVEHEAHTPGGKVMARQPIGYMIGIAPMDLVISDTVIAVVEIDYVFGRPGRRKYRRSEHRHVNCHTGADGQIASSTMYATR